MNNEIMSTQMLKLVPIYKESRGNLRYLGFYAPVSFTDLGGYLIVHLKQDAVKGDVDAINKSLRNYFGPLTLVFTTEVDIGFFVLEPMTKDEQVEWGKIGAPIVFDGREGQEFNLNLENQKNQKEV